MYAVGLGSVIGGRVLVVTTLGRKTSKPRSAALLYVEENRVVFCCSRRGSKSQWVRNLVRNPDSRLRIGRAIWRGQAKMIKSPREQERVLNRFQAKYGAAATVLLKKERVSIVAFSLDDG